MGVKHNERIYDVLSITNILRGNVSVPLRGNGCETSVIFTAPGSVSACFRPLAG